MTILEGKFAASTASVYVLKIIAAFIVVWFAIAIWNAITIGSVQSWLLNVIGIVFTLVCFGTFRFLYWISKGDITAIEMMLRKALEKDE